MHHFKTRFGVVENLKSLLDCCWFVTLLTGYIFETQFASVSMSVVELDKIINLWG